MTDNITLPRSVVEQALEALNSFEQNYGELWQTPRTAEQLDAVAAALRAALEQPETGFPVSVPAGWKLVPVEPTKDMKTAGAFAAMDQVRRSYNPPGAYILVDSMALLSYRAMLAAAPQPPVVEQPQSVTDCHQSQPQGEQEPNPRWPSNASEVRAFLSGRVATERYARDDHQPDDNDTYTLSAHDLLEAIDWWTDFDPQPKREPLTDKEIKAMWKFPRDLSWIDSIVRLVREVEAAHGIGGEK